ncbi:hypothetical protein [Prevotella fusca]
MNRMRNVLALCVLLSSLIQGSAAGFVKENKLYVIDGIVLDLPDADEGDFMFEERNDTLYIMPLTYFTLDGAGLFFPDDICVVNLQETIAIGVKQEITDDTPAVWLDFSSERNRLETRIKQKYFVWTSQEQEEYLHRHHWEAVKELSLQFQKMYYNNILAKQTEYKECCPEYIEQARDILAMKDKDFVSFKQLRVYPQIKYRTITIRYWKQQEYRHIVVVEKPL